MKEIEYVLKKVFLAKVEAQDFVLRLDRRKENPMSRILPAFLFDLLHGFVIIAAYFSIWIFFLYENADILPFDPW